MGDFQTFTGKVNNFGADGLAFESPFGAKAVFEFVAVMVYFFLVTKGCGSTLPGWFFDAMMITSVFWFNKDAIFTPARIWSDGYNWSTMFGTYLNNFAGVFFGINISNYVFGKNNLKPTFSIE